MKTLDFTQSTPAAVWTVEHNFGTPVVSEVYADLPGGRQKMLPFNVASPDNNTLVITFTAPFTGAVRVISVDIDLGALTGPANQQYGTVE